MFTVTVRDHVMIAHSFKGDLFGPAQRLHGATYVVDVRISAETLDANGVVVDIGAAHSALSDILQPWAYRNLDELDEFADKNTTTEFLAKTAFDRLAAVARDGGLGRPGFELASIEVVFNESHVASAGYHGTI
ncbi:MAG: 6-carboxytetrahydropterin synthase [Thalassobaculaceae bacterium]|nr:6-carboxytetrahydropterin synthase [Thalassobaculaceae bacterium]